MTRIPVKNSGDVDIMEKLTTDTLPLKACGVHTFPYDSSSSLTVQTVLREPIVEF
jgi:hypothetical protein